MENAGRVGRFVPMQRIRALRLVLLCGLLAGCEGERPSFGYFSDLQYTADGRALVLEGSDGIYVAIPPESPPKRISERHCAASQTSSLDCVRISADGSRLAILSRPRGDRNAPIWDLHQFRIRDAERPLMPFERIEPELVTTSAYDAAWSQDGQTLVYAKPGPEVRTVSLYRLAPGNVEEQLVRSIDLGQSSPVNGGSSFVLTPYGVAYPRQTRDGVEVWFRPWDGKLLSIGNVRRECGGANFNRCVVPTHDGSGLVWQDDKTFVLNVFRPQQELVLPLGRGYGFGFTQTGHFALRMDLFPDAAHIQQVDTAAVVRSVVPTISAQLSNDGETISYLQPESETSGAARLFIGPTREQGRDHDYDVFEPAKVHPLVGMNVGLSEIEHSFSGDARFVVVNAKGSSDRTARLVSVVVGTSERVELDEVSCTSCCITAPQGTSLICLPTLTQDAAEPLPIDLYDLQTGKKTRVAERAIALEFLYDGNGLGVLELRSSASAELVVAAKDGTVKRVGSAIRFALSPTGPQLAWLSPTGALTVRPLP